MTATARQAKAPRESKKGVPRRFRKDNERAKKNEEEHLDGVEQAVLLTLPPRPAPPAKPERIPLRDREKLAIARPVMRNPKGEIKATAAIAANRVAHHTCRLDLHALRFVCSTGRGARRLVVGVHEYVQMPDSLRVLAELSDGAHPNSKEHANLARKYVKRRKARVKHVQATAGIVVPCVLVALIALWLLAGWATIPLVLVALSSGLAFYGRRRPGGPRPVMQIDNRPVQRIEGRPTPELIHEAFRQAGIDGVSCETAPHREGPGWETVIKIPVGRQTFADAVKAHGTIAGNLGIGSECLFLSPVRGHGGSTKHVRVWHTKTDPFAGDPPPHPLLDPRSGPADLWNSGLPIGLDARGTIARIAVVDTPGIAVIGQPGAGKTFLIFGIGIGVTADPIWDADVWSFKDSDDYAPLKPLVEACGGTYDYGSDAKTIDRFVRYLIRQIADVKEQNEALGDLPIDDNPNAKVERDVAAARGSRFRPKVIVADEIITAIEGDSRVLPLLEELNRIMRSLNRVFVFGAQFADSGTFENLQKLIGATVCLSVKRWQDSKGALGSDHVPGMSEADKIPLSAKGVAFVAGALEDPEIGSRPAFKIRTFRTDRRLLADHVARCLATARSEQGGPKVQLAKADPEDAAFRAKVADLFQPGETALTYMALGERMGLGTGAWAGRRFAEQARDRIEARTDADGKATGSRGASYVALEQLTDDG